MVWVWMLWLPYVFGTRMELRVWPWMLWLAYALERERNYGLGMDALVSMCSWNANGNMVWAWMLWLAYALGTRTELWFGHGCSGWRVLLERERKYGLDMDALLSVCSWNTNGIKGLGMDALVSVCSWNTNTIMVWAWMLWLACALGTRMEFPPHLRKTPAYPRVGFVPRGI